MDGDSMQVRIQGDLIQYTNLLQEFLNKYADADQANDLAIKILQRFNKVFIDAIR